MFDWRYSKTKRQKNITLVNPVISDGTERLQELLRLFFDKLAGKPTLYIIDDCSASKELTKKKDMLSELAFSDMQTNQCGLFHRDIFLF